jgi:hypothetical protein
VLTTGQRSCWDADGQPMPCHGSGQDAESFSGTPWPEPRFEASGGVVRDRLTGLQWLEDANLCQWPLTWHEAHERVAGLARRAHAGRNDWRLPTRRELRSLVCHQNARPALPDGHPFTNVFLGWYWSSTTAARNRDYAWSLQITGGRMFFHHKDDLALVWPCRGESPVLPTTGDPADENVGMPWPEPRFREIGEVILDELTGLWWPRQADLAARPVDWTGALGRVRIANGRQLGGTSRWRLPTINELESLVDASRHDPSLPAGHPFAAVRGGYWSSTTSPFEPDWAMVLHLDRGAVGVGIKRDPRYFVWPVSC